jgi:glutamyl-tRNA synthetase
MNVPTTARPKEGLGRYAPSPSGRLHVGNLRTALLAWLTAESSGRGFILRFEDLDPDRTAVEKAAQQETDLASIGLTWDATPQFQSQRGHLYDEAINKLEEQELTYPCWCTRAELAAAAPHDPQRPYQGTCRHLTDAQRREKEASTGRPGTLRARLGDVEVEWDDLVLGPQRGIASDPVLRRFDGVHAYNLAVVVDDAEQGIDQVLRGNDLAAAVPIQAALCDALDLPRPQWAHVPLVVEEDGTRLAKRDGATTLADWPAEGTALAQLGASIGLCSHLDVDVTTDGLLANFDINAIPREQWVFNRS